MIKYLDESLQKISFHGNLTILIIEYLSLYCLYLNNLKIRINPEIDFSLIPYFNLRISNLFLYIFREISSDRDFTDEVMEI